MVKATRPIQPSTFEYISSDRHKHTDGYILKEVCLKLLAYSKLRVIGICSNNFEIPLCKTKTNDVMYILLFGSTDYGQTDNQNGGRTDKPSL